MSRLTNAEKERYLVNLTRDGFWCATCPKCGKTFKATDFSMTQVGVVTSVKIHEDDCNEEDTTSAS